ncbi:hypothetical protein PAMP_021278 [Pampus punctatissimus]
MGKSSIELFYTGNVGQPPPQHREATISANAIQQRGLQQNEYVRGLKTGKEG